MNWFSSLLAEIAMVPFIGWGIYTLRRRYRYHDDLSLGFEAGTLLGVGLLFVVEVALLRVWGSRQPLLYLFALLGLCLATVALYGHVAISLVSRLLVDFVLESGESDSGQPRFGPAESLERQKDYQGALREYMVLARIYPSNPTVLCRVGENLIRLDRHRDAVPWFERALRHLDTPARAGSVAARLAGTLHSDLAETAKARAVLDRFIERFPDTPDAVKATAFLTEMEPQARREMSDQLTKIAEDIPDRPVTEAMPAIPTAKPEAPHEPSLTALEAAPIHDPEEEVEVDVEPAASPGVGASSVTLIETPLTDDADVDTWDDLIKHSPGGGRLELEAMEDEAPSKEAPEPEEHAPHHSSRLEPLDPGQNRPGR